MFNKNLRLTGKHAKILKRYSKDKQAEETQNFTVFSDLPTESHKKYDIYLFNTLYDCFITATLIGIIEDRKAESDNSIDVNATIFSDKLNASQNEIDRVFKLLVFTKYNLTLDEKIKKVFTLEKVDDEMDEKIFLDYTRGGLEIIDEKFSSSQNIRDVLISIKEIIEKYSLNKN